MADDPRRPYDLCNLFYARSLLGASGIRRGADVRGRSHAGLARYALGLIGALMVVAASAPAAVASPQPPSLRLFAMAHRVTLTQAYLRAGAFDLGAWVSSTGGAFQIDLRRPGYGPWVAEQIDPATGAPLRLLPRELVAPEQGFLGFLSLRFVDSRGRLAGRRVVPFCPDGESARVNDAGPINPSYPSGCDTDPSFPFIRGAVWGIDPGWAVSASTGTLPGLGPVFFFPGPPFGPVNPHSGIDLNPGRYTALVTITSPYRRLFAIPAADATVSLRLGVTPSPRSRTGPGSTQVIQVAQPLARDATDPPAVPTVTKPDAATMPNLVALPAWRIGIHRRSGRDLLTFNATVWNAGPAPFSIEGFRRPNSDVMEAYEYFFDPAGNVVGRAPAGTMFYDNGRGHHHWHLRQLASYTLIGPSGQVIQSEKQSFCIAPTDPVDLTMPNAAMAPTAFQSLGFAGSACDLYDPGAIWLREQLPVGWGDTYSQFVAGQAFDVTNLPNGRYRLDVRVNALGELTETTTADDVASRVIRLSGHRGARKVSVAPWHGIRG
jgi:hypothetical protein